MGNKIRVERHDGRIQKMFYGIHKNTRNKEMEEMEMIQGKMLRKIYHVPPSTSYWGLLIELGMKPI